MALSTATFQSTRATVAAAGTAVAATLALPDNCHTIIFLNRSAAQIIIIGRGALPAGPILDDGTNPVIPAGATLTWNIGTLSERLGTLGDLIFDCDALDANCDLTYLCSVGRG